MVVKAKRGRRRYIAFRVSEGKVSSESLLSFLSSTASAGGLKPPKVIQFDGCMGILRTSDEEKDRMVEALNRGSTTLQLTTLMTSGTLKTLREKCCPSETEGTNKNA
jgi:RNase P/RNase MRP subunit POP5